MYLDFYKLQAPPFQLTPDRRFFFAASQYARALEDLTSDHATAKGFRVITGEVGAGKTTLSHVMRSDLERSDACVAQIVTTQIGPDDLLRMLTAQFEIRRASGKPGALLAGIRDFMIDSHNAGRRVVVFIDEAQNLPSSSFEALFSLMDMEVDGRPLMEVFLVGQSEFQRALASGAMEEVRRRVVSSHHLKPLGPAETRNFILHRLRTVGWRDDPDFSESAYRSIHELTGGVPRRINLICDRLLIDAQLKGLHRIDNGVVIEVLRDAQREGLPIGDLSFDEALQSRQEALCDPECVREKKPEQSTSVPWARQARRHRAANSARAADGARESQEATSTVPRAEPERTTQRSLTAGPRTASPFERSAAAETSVDRSAVRPWYRALRVASPALVGLFVLLTAGPVGIVERADDDVAGQVRDSAIAQSGTGHIEPPAEAGTTVPPAGPAAPSQAASTAAADSQDAAQASLREARPRLAERSPALEVPPEHTGEVEALPWLESPASEDLSSETAVPLSDEWLVLDEMDPPSRESVPESLSETKEVVPSEGQGRSTARGPPSKRAPEPAAVEQSGSPDSATLDAALPGPERLAETDSLAKTDTPEGRAPEPSPAASERLAQAPRMALIDFVLTRDIVDREPVDDLDSFSVADGRAFAFVRIKNSGPPAKISFVWSYGDAVRATVDLDIQTSARWRTWSAITLLPGSWRVEVVSANQVVLGERVFVVEP